MIGRMTKATTANSFAIWIVAINVVKKGTSNIRKGQLMMFAAAVEEAPTKTQSSTKRVKAVKPVLAVT
jgi:hypothetical protein